MLFNFFFFSAEAGNRFQSKFAGRSAETERSGVLSPPLPGRVLPSLSLRARPARGRERQDPQLLLGQIWTLSRFKDTLIAVRYVN